MEVYVEILGTLHCGCSDGVYETGKRYKIFRIYAKNSNEENVLYFNCIVNEGTPSFKLLDSVQLNAGDIALVRGRLRQKFVFEEKTFVNPDTLQKEIKTVQVCKNQVFVNAVTIVNRMNDITNLSNVEMQPNVNRVNNNREKIPVNPNDNPFGN